MSPTRRSESTQLPCVTREVAGVNLHPSRRIIDVGNRCGIWILRGLVKVNRRDDQTASGKTLVYWRIDGPVPNSPDSIVNVEQNGKRAGPPWLIDTHEPRLVAIATICEVEDREVVMS